MKKILILILTVIVLIFAYNQYNEYQRFHPKNANYKTSDAIDINYHDQSTVYQYYEAVTSLNNYVTSQWSANEIDVKSPEKDDAETQLAVNNYSKKLAKVKFYEAILVQSKTLKNRGFNNTDIINIETKNISEEVYKKDLKAEHFKQIMIESLPKTNLRDGEKSAFVYEVQKLLIQKGYDIPLDGVYKTITSEAIKRFEEKQQLFPDGKIDRITLDLLLN